jgi:peptide/nickel transport system permease protein
METIVTRRRRSSLLRRIRVPPWTAVIAGIVIVLLVIVAMFAPFLAPHDPNEVSLTDAFAAPSASHLLGADLSGRDLLSRLIWGSRTALLGPLLIVIVATVVGVLIALVAAWNRGIVDLVASRSLDVIFAFPGILLAILATAVLGFGLPAAIVALSIAYVPYTARIVRSEALRHRGLPYIEASSAQGFSGANVIFRHLLPNVLPLILAQATVQFGYAVIDLSAVSYLGLGVQPPSADWGAMVATGQASILEGYPQESLYAGACIVLAVAAFTILGNWLTLRAERSV